MAPRRRLATAVLFLALCLAASSCSLRTATAPVVESPAGPVAPGLPEGVDLAIERVVDGDTVLVSGRRYVRLIGVDAPETVDPRRPVGCFGKESSGFLKSLLPEGTAVRLVGDVEQEDQYGRTLAYIYRLSDGLFVNAELIRQGFAEVLTISPNVTHADEFVDLARQARSTSKGLWSACPAPS